MKTTEFTRKLERHKQIGKDVAALMRESHEILTAIFKECEEHFGKAPQPWEFSDGENIWTVSWPEVAKEPNVLYRPLVLLPGLSLMATPSIIDRTGITISQKTSESQGLTPITENPPYTWQDQLADRIFQKHPESETMLVSWICQLSGAQGEGWVRSLATKLWVLHTGNSEAVIRDIILKNSPQPGVKPGWELALAKSILLTRPCTLDSVISRVLAAETPFNHGLSELLAKRIFDACYPGLVENELAGLIRNFEEVHASALPGEGNVSDACGISCQAWCESDSQVGVQQSPPPDLLDGDSDDAAG